MMLELPLHREFLTVRKTLFLLGFVDQVMEKIETSRRLKAKWLTDKELNQNCFGLVKLLLMALFEHFFYSILYLL